MHALTQGHFPISRVYESAIASCNTFPQEYAAHVFQLQANFINGGLILTFAGQHQTMIMTGQAHLISLFSNACTNTVPTAQEKSF